MNVLRRAGHYATYVAVRILFCVIQALPIESCETIAGWCAVLLADVLRIRRRVLLDNLRLAFPEMSDGERLDVARDMWKHLVLLLAEVAQAPRKIHDTNWRQYVQIDDDGRRLVRLLLDDRPVVVVSGHFGNFELGGYLLGVLGFPTYTVARTLDNPYLDRFINGFREASGQHIIPKKGGYEQILAVLTGGGTMTFLADQYAGSRACWVEFFGRPASTHKAIALFALQHDAPLVVGSTRRLGRPFQYVMRTEGIVDPRTADAQLGTVRGLTQWYTSQLETIIRRSPKQYWWLHRRWKGQPPQRRRRAAA